MLFLTYFPMALSTMISINGQDTGYQYNENLPPSTHSSLENSSTRSNCESREVEDHVIIDLSDEKPLYNSILRLVEQKSSTSSQETLTPTENSSFINEQNDSNKIRNIWEYIKKHNLVYATVGIVFMILPIISYLYSNKLTSLSYIFSFLFVFLIGLFLTIGSQIRKKQ